MNKILGLVWPSERTHVGPLEEQLLKLLWSRQSATVREIVDEEALSLAYTTVMTTLDRLYKKGLLNRVAEGRAFRYSPVHSQEELNRQAAAEAIRQLLTSDGTGSLPLSYLVEVVSEHDARLLDELQVILEQKRRDLRGKEK